MLFPFSGRWRCGLGGEETLYSSCPSAASKNGGTEQDSSLVKVTQRVDPHVNASSGAAPFHNHRAVGGRVARTYSSHFIDEKVDTEKGC